MFKSIYADLQRTFQYGNMLNRIILVNVGVYIFINVLYVVLFLSNAGKVPVFYHDFIHFFALSSDWKEVLLHPWSIISHMFMHEGFWHFLFNMLILYWFGRIIGDLLGDHRVLPIYVYGGLAGGLAYFIAVNVFGFLQTGTVYALGASAGVMAIVVASAATAPDYIMRLILIGDVKIKYIALVLILIDVFGIGSMINTGGHFGHLGGAAFGGIFVTLLRNGNDLSEGFNRVFDRITQWFDRSRRPQKRGPLNVVHKKEKKTTEKQNSPEHQEMLDRILDKINTHGYENLTEEEKDFLYKASKK